ncbi:MAG: NHLP family bacteriocin export ABC transporter peptidase/permease/ATPase subunit [Coriobacteriales bacterium]|nr:NHLP family bacteriocin export ABC transporter peptidase/permease/ATPase subunit [Coriobacteriales bacterium]
MARKVEKVPQIMQMEALECGAACLTMILAYYGRWVPLEQIRAACGVSRDGSKAVNMLKAARSYGLAAKGRTYSAKALLKKGKLPSILFWNFNHFVVLRGFSRNGRWAYLNDPAAGQVRVAFEEFSSSFTGIALEFEPTEAFEKGGNPPSTIEFVRERLKGMGPAIAFVMLTAAITSLVGIFFTSLSRVFVDQVLSGNEPEWIFPLTFIMLGLSLISGIVSVLNAVYLVRIQGKIAVVSSSRFMRHLLHLPVGFYAQRMVGDLQQRQNSNEYIVATLIGQLAPALINIIMLVLYLVVMVRYSLLLTLVGVTTVIMNALVAHIISRKRVNIARSMTMDSGKLYATTVGGVEMIETIKSAGAETGYFGRWAGYQASVNNSMVHLVSINETLGLIPQLLTQFASVLVLTLGIWLVVNGAFTVGALLAFQGFLSSFMAPVTQIISLGQTVQETQTDMERVQDVLRYPTDVPEDPRDEAKDLKDATEFSREKLMGRVDLKDVTFGYSPLEPPLIENFNLHIEPGRWVALVGGSGSGKSTVAKLVSGLYEPWAGTVSFDGIPRKEIPRPVMTGSLAVVDQDIVSFDGSVRDNVKLWDETIQDFEVIMACRDAGVHELVASREGGYSSKMLPGGRNFSGGQLQRLEIARVLAQDPTVIILDEATSALDAQTEAKVIERIRMRDITCIVVAHRLSTIRDCDEIIVLDEGKVVERGTHDELIAANGAYADLVRSD